LAALVTFEGGAPALRKTTEYAAMRDLALRAGLEDGNFGDYDVAYGYYVDETLVGCAALKVKDGLFTVECLAVAEEYRGRGMGRALITVIEAEAAARGAGQLWALARAPGFFIRNGYHQAEPHTPGGPSMQGCATCPQFNRNCSPAIVYKRL
jgi:N-acetylglutamate synthase-like GNAT family acetyltransferase